MAMVDSAQLSHRELQENGKMDIFFKNSFQS